MQKKYFRMSPAKNVCQSVKRYVLFHVDSEYGIEQLSDSTEASTKEERILNDILPPFYHIHVPQGKAFNNWQTKKNYNRGT